MSYIILINNLQLEFNSTFFALTKVNNDIADISNRNVDFSQNIKIPRTSKNNKIFELTGLVGISSEFPYKKNIARVIDANTGIDIVSDGIALLLSTDSQNYNITIYSSTINFFKAIENLTLTECNLSALNHFKTLANVKETWTNETLPYRYIISDYNGKFLTNNFNINIDYQVPSASAKYLFERVFSKIGYTFEGSIFQNSEFLELYLNYPKPILNDGSPNLVLINSQTSSDVTYQYSFYPTNSNALFTATANRLDLHRTNFSETRARLTNANSWSNVTIPVSGQVPNLAIIEILEAGSYLIRVLTLPFKINIYDNLGAFVETLSSINTDITFNALLNYKIQIVHLGDAGVNDIGIPNTFLGLGNVNVALYYIDGYQLGFENAFIDFKVSDFIKEIMMRFALTPFEIPKTKKIKFLTLNEIFQDNDVQDWSKIFQRITNESYILPKYAQNNLIKYKYNDEKEAFNDGKIVVKNTNIKEEIVLFQSLFFSPNKEFSKETNRNVFPIWEKKIKDNNTIEYKGLDNRFYFLKSTKNNSTITIGSDINNNNLSAEYYFQDNYFRCKWSELLNVWYKDINKILDFTKIITAEIYFTPFSFSQVKMEKRIFIKQLGSYFLINKILNFTPQKLTKVELIKVDYYIEPTEFNTDAPFLNILNYSITNCNITFNVNTNLANGQILYLYLYTKDYFGTYIDIPFYTEVQSTLNNNAITFSLSNFNNVTTDKFAKITGLRNTDFQNIASTILEVTTNFPNNCFVATTEPITLTLLTAVYQGISNLGAPKYLLTYNFSTITPNKYLLEFEVFVSNSYTLYAGTYAEKTFNGWTNLNAFEKNQSYFGVTLEKEVIVDLAYIYTILTNVTKFRIKINSTISNELTL
jgi:hypothetical protein